MWKIWSNTIFTVRLILPCRTMRQTHKDVVSSSYTNISVTIESPFAIIYFKKSTQVKSRDNSRAKWSKEEPRKTSQEEQHVFTARQCKGMCSKYKNNCCVRTIRVMWCFGKEENSLTRRSTATPVAHWQRTTCLLCYGIKEDLVSLWLEMTLATRLALARSTR